MDSSSPVPKMQKLHYTLPPAPRRRGHSKGSTSSNSPTKRPKTLLSINSPAVGQISSAESVINDGDVHCEPLHGLSENGNGETERVLSHCLCTDRSTMTSKLANSDKPVFCEASDTFDNKTVKCMNHVSQFSMFRPSDKVPHRLFCEVHLGRLRRHHCCPGCGEFCTQGEFLECMAIKKQVHIFHKSCQPLLDVGPLKQICPHCSNVTPQLAVQLQMNGPVANTVYNLVQHPALSVPRAKMTLNKIRELPAISELNKSKEQGVEFTISDTQKILSLAGMPYGLERKEIEEMLNQLIAQSEKMASPKLQSFGNKNFYKLVEGNERDKVIRLLIQGFDPNHVFTDIRNETALHAAASKGHLGMVHLLVQAGANLNVINASLNTPLILAVLKEENNPVVRYLIHAGAAIDVKGEDGMTALHMAAKAGNMDAVSFLLGTTKIDINTIDEGGWTALVWATEHKHHDLVKFLLSKGADPNIKDDEENVGLHWAAFSGEMNIAYLLLEMNCDINAVNMHGDTPLHIAARRDNHECVLLFLNRGADVNITNKNNDTPLKCALPATESEIALRVNMQLKRTSLNRHNDSERYLSRDISRGREGVQIPAVNGVDGEPLPIDYTYIVENCETSEKISIDRTINSLQACNCEDDCSTGNCLCGSISFQTWYDREGKLIEEFNYFDPPLIFECNRACACWKSCLNRNVQLGIRCRLQIFRTKKKGWAVRALKEIPKGTFVCEYIGEIITDVEADRREDDSYLFDLDNKDGEIFCLDARYYGNVSRFINHSCDSNLTPIKVFVDHQDLSFPRIALFANRDIAIYEELSFDYGIKFWQIKYKDFLCDCGADKCKYNSSTIHPTLENYYRKQVVG